MGLCHMKIMKQLEASLTSTESLGSSKYPALLDLSVRREHHPDVVLVTFLGDHSDEEFSVLHCCIQDKTSFEELPACSGGNTDDDDGTVLVPFP